MKLSQILFSINGCKNVLTVVSVASEQLVVTDEVRASAEMRPLGNEDFLDEGEVVDDDAGSGAQGETVDVAVDLGQRGERDEGVGVLAEDVEVAKHRPGGGSRGLRGVRALPASLGQQQYD